jgi:ribonuclease Z
MGVRRGVVEAEYRDTYSRMAQAREVRIDTDEAVTVYDKDGIIVRAFRVVHPDWLYAYGYRIEFRGKTLVVSGDTRYTPAVVRYAKDADMLIHEALNVKMMSIAGEVMEEQSAGIINPDRMKHISARHTPTDRVAHAAAEANVETLVLTHFTPPIPALAVVEHIFTRGMDETFDGEIVVARDGMRITLIE